MNLINSILYILRGHDVQKEISELQAQLSDAKNANSQAVNEKKHAEEENHSLKEQLKEARRDNIALSSQVKEHKKLDETNKSLHDKNNSLKGEISTKESKIKSLQDENNQLKKDKEIILKENSELKETCNSLRTKVNDFVRKLDKQATESSNDEEIIAKGEEPQTVNNEETEGGNQDDDLETEETIQSGTPNSEEVTNNQDGIPETEIKEDVADKTSPQLSTTSQVKEAISLSNGEIEDFPDIVNDTRHNSNRTIRYVFDNNYKTILAKQFFENSKPEYIAKVSRDLAIAYKTHQLLWYCPKCHQAVKIAHWKNSLFFIHAEKNGICEWRNPSQKSQEQIQQETSPTLDDEEVALNDPSVIKYQELKNRIYAALTTKKSQRNITNVHIDSPVYDIHDNKWKRADISFNYKDRLWVIELQHKGQGTSYIAEKDKFYRINKVQTLWVFGSDSDTSYEYMNDFNYKTTLFDSHRNAFVFDKQAQQETSALGELRLKCNWLDGNDEWHFKIKKDGINGETIGLDDLIVDDDHCKPYFFNNNQNDVKEAITVSSLNDKRKAQSDDNINNVSKEGKKLEEADERDKESIEEKAGVSQGEPLHDGAVQPVLNDEEQRFKEAHPFSINGFWGFKSGNVILIKPTFTERPKVTSNGYFQVCNDGNIGIVDKYGKRVVDWNGIIQCNDMDYDAIYGRILFNRNGKWGVADKKGNILIEPDYSEIKPWSYNIYKVCKQALSGLCNIHNELVLECKYSYIGELNNGKASVQKKHPFDELSYVMGSVGSDGKPITSLSRKQPDGNIAIRQVGLWGLISTEGKVLIPCKYDTLEYLLDGFYAVNFGKKLGAIRISDGSLFYKNDKGNVTFLKDGKETIINYSTGNSSSNEHKTMQKAKDNANNGKKVHETVQIKVTGVVRRRIKNHGKVTDLVVALLKDGRHIVVSESSFTAPMPKIFSFHVGDRINLIKKYNKKSNQTVWQVI